MSEMTMVERVAMAICVARRPNKATERAAGVSDERYWREHGSRQIYLDAARAAIAAMREPTPQMIGSAHEAGIATRWALPVWLAMIDEALR